MDDTNNLRTAAQAVVDATSLSELMHKRWALEDALAQPEPATTPAAAPRDSIEVARLWDVFRESVEGQRALGWIGGPSSEAHGAMFIAFRAGLNVTEPPPVALPSVVDAEARELHLDIVEQGFTALIDSLMPSFEYVGVALRVSAEDHAAIRSAMAGARTSMRLLKNARAALATHPAPASASEPERTYCRFCGGVNRVGCRWCDPTRASASVAGASEPLQAMADNERELGLGYETGASEETWRNDAYVGKRLRLLWKLTGHPSLDDFTDEAVANSAFTLLGTIRASLERANEALTNSVGLTIADLANPSGRAALAAPQTLVHADVERDAARYRLLRRGQHWSVIDWKGDDLRGEVLDATVDAKLAARQPSTEGGANG